MNYSIHILENQRDKKEWLKQGVEMKELEHIYQVISSAEFYSNMVRYDGTIGEPRIKKSIQKEFTSPQLKTFLSTGLIIYIQKL